MKQILILCCALLSTIGLKAQFTLDHCQQMARENYPQIRQYDLIRQTTQYTLSNANRAWLPQLSLTAQATWQSAVPGFPEQMLGLLSPLGLTIPGLNKDQYRVQLELTQTIWDGGKGRADKMVTMAENAESQSGVDVDLYALNERINDLYFGLLLLDERILQTRLTIDLLRNNLDKIHTLYKNGTAMQCDIDAMEAELLTSKQQLMQIESSRQNYRHMLSIFIGQEIADNKLNRPELVEPTTTTSARPELVLFDAMILKLSAQEQLVRSSSRPRFNLFAQGYYGYPGMDYFRNMINSDWSWNAMIGVKMSWNFGSYYTKKNSIGKLRIAKQQIDVQRDIFSFNNRLRLTEQMGEIARLRNVLTDDDRIVALRRSIRHAAEAKLQSGVIDTNDLLQRITDEERAIVKRNAREIELLKAIYELKYTINQ